MRKLSLKRRLQAPSLKEIVHSFEGVAHELSATYEFQGRKLSPGPLLSAVILVYSRLMTAEQQHEIARLGLEEQERLCELDEPNGGPPPPKRPRRTPGVIPTKSVSVASPPPPKRTPRGKKTG